MIYSNTTEGRFIRRHNRFTAEVEIAGIVEPVHVKNTGRCRELLLPDAKVFLTRSDNPVRKTRYDLIAVEKVRPGGDVLLINMDSQIPNDAVFEWLPEAGFFSHKAVFKREVCCGKSRFDIFVEDGERKVFIEVKGVTLEKDSIAFFPDAPTERGVKHLKELAALTQDGFETWGVFVIQMKGIAAFRPCDEIHPEFGSALRQAAAAGVKVMAMDCIITPGSIKIDSPVRVEL